MQTLPFSEARAQLAEVLRGIEAGEAPVLISRRGHASGVLMSVARYQQLSGAGGSVVDCLQNWRANHLAQTLESAEPAGPGEAAAGQADPFEGVRQADVPRPFAW